MIGKNISRIVGVVWIITSVLWGILGVIGIIYVSNWIENTQSKLIDDFSIVGETLESVRNVMVETNEAISLTHQSLGTLQRSIHDTSDTLTDLRPLIRKTTKVVTLDVPDALDGVQVSMPSLIETAKSVDETLIWLSSFKITIPNPFGADWTYDLGISYNPEVPLDQALESMSQNLVDIPEDLRGLDESLSTTDNNLIVVADDLELLADSIDATNQRIDAIAPEMKNFVGNIDDIQGSLQESQNTIIEILENGRKVLTAIFVLLIFSQIPSLFMGIQLIKGTQMFDHSLNESEKPN